MTPAVVPNHALSLHPGQFEVFREKARFKVVVAGRRWGKTQLAKSAIISMARVRKRLIWYVAPTYRMAKQIMWSELLDSIPKKWIKKQNETVMQIVLVNGTVIELKGADKPDTLRGVGLHFLVLDEFQDMRPDVWTKVLRPTLASTGGHALFIGTPKSFNHLYELWSLGQKKELRDANVWKSWQFPTIMSPFIPPEEIEAAKRDMDEKSFRQEFEACHLPETEVRLWDGSVKPICKMEPGDMVPFITPEGGRKACEVLRVGETGEKVILEVTLETGEVIRASAHHKFKVHTDAA